MSALPPITDIPRTAWNVRFVPEGDIAARASLDHLVGTACGVSGTQGERLSLHSLLTNTHLLVGIDQEMIEAFDTDQAEPRKFHVRNDVEGCRKGGREGHHVYPTARLGSSHSEAGKKRPTQPETEQHHIDNLRWMLIGRANTQSLDVEYGAKG